MTHSSPEQITYDDFLRLKQNPQPYARAAIARKMAGCFDVAKPDSSSYQVAAEIALYLQKDKNEMVRSTLAEAVKQSTTAPKKLVLLLANDAEDEVAVPILRESPLLDDEDLTVLVKETESQVRLVAVAERKFLSVRMCQLVTEKGYERVAVTLLANKTSRIADETYFRMAELHHQSNPVLQQMMKRIPMPKQAIEAMQQAVANKPEDKGVQSFVAVQAQELRGIALLVMRLGDSPGASECLKLAGQFHSQKKINPTTLLIVLCLGQLGLFFACLSVATGITYEEVEQHYANQPAKLNTLLVKAGVSSSLLMLMQWGWKGAHTRLEQGLKPCSKQMIKLSSIHLHEGGRRGINFASTIGLPVAAMLSELV